MVNTLNDQTERAFGTVGFADPSIVDPTTSKPYTPESSLRQQESKPDLNLDNNLKETVKKIMGEPESTKDLPPQQEGFLRPRARPKNIKPIRQSPINKILELGYLMRGESDPRSKTTKIVSDFSSDNPDAMKALKGWMDSAVGGKSGLDPVKDAWCATFITHILSELGADRLKTKDSYDRVRANAYRKYGTVVAPEEIKEGDLVLFDWDKDGEADHVTFYAGDRITSQNNSNYINVVGGNQVEFDPEGREKFGISIREDHEGYTWNNVMDVRRITYNDINYEFTEELANQDPAFLKFLKPTPKKGFNKGGLPNYGPPGTGSSSSSSGSGYSFGNTPVGNLSGSSSNKSSASSGYGQMASSLKDAGVNLSGSKSYSEQAREIQSNYEKSQALAGRDRNDDNNTGSINKTRNKKEADQLGIVAFIDKQTNNVVAAGNLERGTLTYSRQGNNRFAQRMDALKSRATVPSIKNPSGTLSFGPAKLGIDKGSMYGQLNLGSFKFSASNRVDLTKDMDVKVDPQSDFQINYDAKEAIKNWAEKAGLTINLADITLDSDGKDAAISINLGATFNKVSYNKGGDVSKKGMSYGELIVDNILGLDNEYESFGEKLGKAINEDEIGFLKDAALGIYEGARDFVSAPVESTKEIISDVKKSVERLGRENLDTRLRNMYNVSYKDATYKQVTDAKQAVISDAITALELVPVGAAAVKGTKAAVEAGVKAIPPDAIGQTKALLEGDKEFLKGTPTPEANTAGIGAQVVGQEDVSLDDINDFINSKVKPTKSKKETNLLVKEREYDSGVPSDLYDFRSSILGSLDNLAIGKDGMSGLQIKKFLEKRAPKINKTELYWSGLLENLEDNKKYSKSELENLIDYNVPRVDIKVFGGPSETRYFGTQRVVFQRNDPFNDEIIEPLDEYREILLVNHNTKGTEYSSADAHFRLPEGQNLLGHVRGSFVEADPDPNADFAIKEKFFVVEELQSDAVQQHTVADKATAKYIKNLETEKPTLGDIGLYYRTELQDLAFGYHMYGTDFSDKFIKQINRYGTNFNSITDMDDAETAIRVGLNDIVNELTDIKERHINYDMPPFAVAAILSKKLGLKETSLRKRSIEDLDEVDNILANAFSDYVFGKSNARKYNRENNNQLKNDLIKVFKSIGIKDPIEIGLVPTKLSDTIRMSLLATIKEAKFEDTNKIYIPSPEVIAKAHDLSLDAAKNTYKDGVKKVLRSLNSETNGKIKFKNKNPDGLHYYEDYESTGIEIDITDFELPQDPQFRFAEGGSVKNMSRQMEMMFEEGGIADDGMRIDPVSGNEIPPGSMAKEVRDDVPAQLSEGEYVVPADVVRFFGVKFFEDLRTEAKRGLVQMEKDGRIGGEPVEEPVRPQPERMERPRRNVAMSRGGMIATSLPAIKKRKFNEGGDNTTPQRQNRMPNLSGYGFGSGTANLFNFFKKMAPPPGLITVEYQNQAGEKRYYTFVNGQIQPPGTKIAAGFFPVNTNYDVPTGVDLTQPETPTPVATTPSTSDDRDGRGDPQETPDGNAWQDKYDYTNVENLISQSSEALQPPTGLKGLLSKGLIGKIGQLTSASEVAAHISLLENSIENGAIQDPATIQALNDLKSDWSNFVEKNNLDVLGQEVINGDQKMISIVTNPKYEGMDIFTFTSDVKDPFGNRIFTGDDDPKFVEVMQAVARPGYTYVPGDDNNLGSYKADSGTSLAPDTSLRPQSRPDNVTPTPTPTSTNVKNKDDSRKAHDAAHQAFVDRVSQAKSEEERADVVEKETGVEISGKQEEAGAGVGSGVGGTNLTGPFNRGGLVKRRK